ncbi:ABC transporter permease [Aquabacter sp. CN5-332]|uniref:ABC transporter permease n=1 Tax=Aquabacter sp. CN5-332 TaxID=3156608 RepID=UPI0032B627B5
MAITQTFPGNTSTAAAKPKAPLPRPRADFECTLADASGIGEVQRRLSLPERLANNDAVRRAGVLLLLIVVWEVYARWADNPLLFPTFSLTLETFLRDLLDGTLIDRTRTSLYPLALGYLGGIVLAAILTSLAVSSRIGADILTTLTAMFNPLPAIAVLPLALIWFGLGIPSLVFVIIHSVLWAVSLSTLTGFRSVPETLRLSGRNYGLKGVRYVALILIPAAFPAILAGLKIGWAFAWRTLVAAELVFGVSSRSGGLGWYIFEARSELDTPKVFAGLLTVILIGLFVESIIFRSIEARTVQKWGMQR